MKIIFASYNNQPGVDAPQPWIEKIKSFAGLMHSLARHCPVVYIKQVNYEGSLLQNGVEYVFLPTKKQKHRFPWRLNNRIKKLQPSVVIISGMRYPLQIIQLRWQLGRGVKILARHHAELPPTGLRKKLQILADKCINAYLFNAAGNAAAWLNTGVIADKNKILELPASSGFQRSDKNDSRIKTGMPVGTNFIWVGNLTANKDPLTVLAAFKKYAEVTPGVKLYMLFQTAELKEAVEAMISASEVLKQSVILTGAIPYSEMPLWYSAADYFISGSHQEGGSFALAEAMACGCIPIVTGIPAALTTIEGGKYGITFRAGDADDLAEKLRGLSPEGKTNFSQLVENYFHETLSAANAAEKLYSYCKKLTGE